MLQYPTNYLNFKIIVLKKERPVKWKCAA
jgi:hypothetical protein